MSLVIFRVIGWLCGRNILWQEEVLPTASNVAEIFSAIVAGIALVCGGIWALYRFKKYRLRYPHANIDVDIFSFGILPGTVGVRVALHVSNSGSVLLSPKSAEIWLRQVVPDVLCKVIPGRDPVREGEQKIEWPSLAKREWKFRDGEFEIEPDESDYLYADFVIDEGVSVIELYSHIPNPAKNDIGWTKTVMHCLM